jgi:hypothetical protein
MRAFDARAVGVLEEAFALGSVPQFSVASAAPVDLRALPPCLAEARPQASTTLSPVSTTPNPGVYHQARAVAPAGPRGPPPARPPRAAPARAPAALRHGARRNVPQHDEPYPQHDEPYPNAGAGRRCTCWRSWRR